MIIIQLLQREILLRRRAFQSRSRDDFLVHVSTLLAAMLLPSTATNFLNVVIFVRILVLLWLVTLAVKLYVEINALNGVNPVAKTST